MNTKRDRETHRSVCTCVNSVRSVSLDLKTCLATRQTAHGPLSQLAYAWRMSLVPLGFDDTRAHALMTAQQRELRKLYNDTDERTEPFDPASLAGGVLLGWEEGGELLAIGGLKPLDRQSAEIKRMYTRPEARGRRLGRAVLDGLIAWGREQHLAQLVLETGDLQAEATSLYQSAGFERIPNFGYYVGIENSLCFALALE